METMSLGSFLRSWPYDSDNNVRLINAADGRQVVIVRQPLGLEHYEVDGRPDGQRPYAMESFLEFQMARLVEADVFKLTSQDCASLFEEAVHYYHRCLSFLRLKDWARAERDSARNLYLLTFVQ